MTESKDPAYIVYDGDCPFCSRYVRMIRLREAIGNVELIDARSGDPRVQALMDRGYDLDEGMALVDGERIYWGDDCINRLALMSTASGAFNRMNALIFRSATASRLLYPVLKAGRRGVLTLLGRKKIRDTI
ncbi:MAG: DCC1-like thiol-disulfide oxidoreductase family protein [Pseudomonadota bacterium]